MAGASDRRRPRPRPENACEGAQAGHAPVPRRGRCRSRYPRRPPRSRRAVAGATRTSPCFPCTAWTGGPIASISRSTSSVTKSPACRIRSAASISSPQRSRDDAAGHGACGYRPRSPPASPQPEWCETAPDGRSDASHPQRLGSTGGGRAASQQVVRTRAVSTPTSTASRVEAMFDVEASTALSDIQKRRVIARAGPRLTAVAQDTRSQARNRELALERLRDRLAAALAVPQEAAADPAFASRGGAAPRSEAPSGGAQASPAPAGHGRVTGADRPALPGFASCVPRWVRRRQLAPSAGLRSLGEDPATPCSLQLASSGCRLQARLSGRDHRRGSGARIPQRRTERPSWSSAIPNSPSRER